MLFYDLTSTYFEADPSFPEGTSGASGIRAITGRIVCRIVIALVRLKICRSLTRCCLATSPTGRRCEGFIECIKRQYDKARRVWLMDRGVPTEEVLADMRDARPAGALPGGHAEGPSDRKANLIAQLWRQARPGVQVKLLAQEGELYVLVAKPRPRRQGASNAATPAEAVVGAAQATVDNAADA